MNRQDIIQWAQEYADGQGDTLAEHVAMRAYNAGCNQAAQDIARLDFMQSKGDRQILKVGDADTECIMYAVAGSPSLSLRQIVDHLMAEETKS